MDKKECKKCGGVAYRHSKTKAGTQRFRCAVCRYVFSEGRSVGRPTLGDRPMTNAERQRRWRERHKPKQ